MYCGSLADYPQKLAAEGKIANVPVIFGTNADEGTLFNKMPTDLPAANYSQWIASECGCLGFVMCYTVSRGCVGLSRRYGEALAEKIVAVYPVEDYPSAFWAASRAEGDSQVFARVSTVSEASTCLLA